MPRFRLSTHVAQKIAFLPLSSHKSKSCQRYGENGEPDTSGDDRSAGSAGHLHPDIY